MSKRDVWVRVDSAGKLLRADTITRIEWSTGPNTYQTEAVYLRATGEPDPLTIKSTYYRTGGDDCESRELIAQLAAGLADAIARAAAVPSGAIVNLEHDGENCAWKIQPLG